MRNFEHTMNVLVKAYFNDTLQHGNCHACAIGNMVADSLGIGYKIGATNVHCENRFNVPVWDQLTPEWQDRFGTLVHPQTKKRQSYFHDYHENMEGPDFQIQQTGYSIKELMRIERTFEMANRGNSDDDWMFNGLMAVLEVLAEIHGVDLEAKKVFETQLLEIHNS